MRWLKNKTTWTGIAAIGAGAVLIYNGNIDTGVQTIIGGFGLIFIRQAIGKVGK
jgi:hypothetical protein